MNNDNQDHRSGSDNSANSNTNTNNGNSSSDSQNTSGGNNSSNQSGGTTRNSNADANGNTRNITVSIQYSYLTPAALNGLNNATRVATAVNPNNSESSPSLANGVLPGAVPNSLTPGMLPEMTPGTIPLPNQQVNPANALPNSSFVLSFRDVPTSTPQSRLESIISIAAELAVRRFTELSSRPKGISQEAFNTLPVMKISELTKQEKDIGCSICYEPYEDEQEEDNKRKRDDDEEDNKEVNDKIKKQKSNPTATDPTVPVTPHTVETPLQPASEAATTAPNTAIPAPTVESEEANPSYLHSATKLTCDHIFGRECLFKWTRLENTCPLCRHKIIESEEEDPNNQTFQAARNSTTEAFERIRNLLYNSYESAGLNPDGTPVSENGTTNTNNESSNNRSETNPSVENVNGTNSTTSNTPATIFGTTGPNIILLGPEFLTNAISNSNNSNSNSNISENNNIDNPNAGTTNLTARIIPANRIHWLPLPINRRTESDSTATSSQPASNSNTTSGGTSTTGITTGETPDEESRYNRFRNLINNFFTQMERGRTDLPDSGNTSLNTTGTPNSSTTRRNNENSSETGEQENVPNDVQLNFYRMGNDIRDTIINNEQQVNGHNGMFSTGVASYRNRNGEVSTYQLNGNQINRTSEQSEQSTLPGSNQISGTNTNEGQSTHEPNSPVTNDEQNNGDHQEGNEDQS